MIEYTDLRDPCDKTVLPSSDVAVPVDVLSSDSSDSSFLAAGIFSV